jgi:hypothetical protein
MINLCNTSSYSNDKQGEDLSKRTPRGNEDIEIIGDIDQDIEINLVQLQSSCGLGNISSLTLPFKTNRAYTLTVAGNGSILDPSNPRAPTGTELENITRTNPLRVAHGWYTMMPGYGIGILNTNSLVSLKNIPFKNSTINATGLILNSSVYSNGILNVNSISLKNASYLYGTTIECTGITLESNSKCDTINITSNLLKLNSSSIAESQFFGSVISTSGSRIVDCELTCEKLEINDSIFQSQFDYKEGSSSNIEDIKFINSTIYNNSQINSKFLFFNTVNIAGGIIKSDTIKFEGDCTIGEDATVATHAISLSGLTNNGILNFNVFSGLITPIITNSGNININNTGNINMTITNNGKLKLNTSGTLEGSNKGIINGPHIKLKRQFINEESGKILSSMTELEDFSINNGYIATAKLSGSAQNVGSLDNGIFSGQGVLNNGLVKVGLFLNSTNNGEVTNLTMEGGTNYGNSSAGTLYNSRNYGSISTGIFYNSIDDGDGTKGSYFGSSVNYGSCLNVLFKDVAIHDSNSVIKTGLFYDKSICRNANGYYDSILNFYSGSELKQAKNFEIINMFNNSKASDKINPTVNFNDNSLATSSFEGNIAFFNDHSQNSGVIKNSYFNDNSINAFGGLVASGLFKDNAINLGTVDDGRAIFNDSAMNSGLLKDSNVIFSGGGTINNGHINNCSVKFYDNAISSVDGFIERQTVDFYNSQNYSQIRDTFSARFFNSNNRGFITANNGGLISFDQSDSVISEIPRIYPPEEGFIVFYDLTSANGSVVFTNQSNNNMTISAETVTFSGYCNNSSFFNLYDNNNVLIATDIPGIVANNVFFQNHSINNKPVEATYIYFDNNSSNNGNNFSTEISFDNFSTNLAKETTNISNKISFDNFSINASSGSCDQWFFNRGSINNGIIQNSQTITLNTSGINNGSIFGGNVSLLSRSINNGYISGTTINLNNSTNNKTIVTNYVSITGLISSDYQNTYYATINSAPGTIALTDPLAPVAVFGFINLGTLSGTFQFKNFSVNLGTIYGYATFDATSVNSGTIIAL